VKSSYRWLACLLTFACCLSAFAAPWPKEKEKEHEGTTIDSGSFGVYQKGHRVGTETFSVNQTSYGSVIYSEFKTENAPTQDVQHSELQLTQVGNIRRYEWKELSPEKSELLLLPNEEFLTQKWSTGPQEKEHEQPYLLPPATNVLDDYFFVHRQILAWKFLGMACKQEKGQAPQCPLKRRAQMGTLNPHQHSSALVSAEFLGRETITIKGAPQDLIKLELASDAGTWDLWLDNQFKVQRISIVGENTVVDRD
jgi:hypothetical protein